MKKGCKKTLACRPRSNMQRLRKCFTIKTLLAIMLVVMISSRNRIDACMSNSSPSQPSRNDNIVRSNGPVNMQRVDSPDSNVEASPNHHEDLVDNSSAETFTRSQNVVDQPPENSPPPNKDYSNQASGESPQTQLPSDSDYDNQNLPSQGYPTETLWVSSTEPWTQASAVWTNPTQSWSSWTQTSQYWARPTWTQATESWTPATQVWTNPTQQWTEATEVWTNPTPEAVPWTPATRPSWSPQTVSWTPPTRGTPPNRPQTWRTAQPSSFSWRTFPPRNPTKSPIVQNSEFKNMRLRPELQSLNAQQPQMISQPNSNNFNQPRGETFGKPTVDSQFNPNPRPRVVQIRPGESVQVQAVGNRAASQTFENPLPEVAARPPSNVPTFQDGQPAADAAMLQPASSADNSAGLPKSRVKQKQKIFVERITRTHRPDSSDTLTTPFLPRSSDSLSTIMTTTHQTENQVSVDAPDRATMIQQTRKYGDIFAISTNRPRPPDNSETATTAFQGPASSEQTMDQEETTGQSTAIQPIRRYGDNIAVSQGKHDELQQHNRVTAELFDQLPSSRATKNNSTKVMLLQATSVHPRFAKFMAKGRPQLESANETLRHTME